MNNINEVQWKAINNRFNWHDVDGKVLNIIVQDDDDGLGVYGLDKSNQEMYLLYFECSHKPN